MYQILHFRGGVYKFDELVEFVEDTGGMVLKKDSFERIRGVYFLSTEVDVLLIIPEDEVAKTEALVNEIQGIVDDIEPTDDQYNLFLSYLSMYDALTKIGGWADKKNLKEAIRCPCYSELCTYLEESECQLDEILDEILTQMCLTEIVEHKESDGKSRFRLKNK